MIKILTKKRYESLIDENKKLRETLKTERQRRKEDVSNFDLIVHCAKKKSDNALKTLLYVTTKAIKEKSTETNSSA